MKPAIIETERLLLRLWQDEDALSYYEMNQDPRVLEFLPGHMTLDEVKIFIHRMNQQFYLKSYTLFAAELIECGTLAGFVGLNEVTFKEAFTPAVEIAWRLGAGFWGKGYATEAAKAVLEYGLKVLDLRSVVAFSVPENKRSLRVMEKIGLCRDYRGDFSHPSLPVSHRLSRHCLYRSLPRA